MKHKKKTLLWKTSSPLSQSISYLFGTVHINHWSVFENLNPILQAINSCDIFATEFDLNEGNAQRTPDFGRLPNGKTLEDYLPQKKYNKTRKIIKKAFDLDIDQYKTFQPIFINSAIAVKILPSDMPYSLDQYLWQYAQKQNKELTGIETFGEQSQTLADMTVEHQIKELVGISKNVSGYQKKMHQLIDLYKEGNPVKLYKSAKQGSGDKRKLMLYNRNEIMAERFANLANENSLFAAIGAAHLAGSKGVLRLLKQKGFKVVPVSQKEELD